MTFVLAKKEQMSNPKILRFIILLLLLIAGLAVLGQDKRSPMIWMEATQKTVFNPQFSTTLLYQRRVFVMKDHTYQQILWAGGNVQLTPKVTLGGGLIYFVYHRNIGERFGNVPEIRPFQYVNFHRQVGAVNLSLRTMAEARFLSTVVHDQVEIADRFNVRVRLRLKGHIPLGKQLLLEVSNEAFFNGHFLSTHTFDQNRWVNRLIYKRGNWQLHGGVMHWWVNGAHGWQHRPTALIGLNYSYSRL